MSNYHQFSFGLFSLLILLLGCGQPYTAQTTDDAYEVKITPLPDPIPLNKLFALQITVKANPGIPLPAESEVTVDARMPDHGHGMNTVTKVSKGKVQGEFLVEGLVFHMSGLWEIAVRIHRKDTESEAIFPVLL